MRIQPPHSLAMRYNAVWQANCLRNGMTQTFQGTVENASLLDIYKKVIHFQSYHEERGWMITNETIHIITNVS